MLVRSSAVQRAAVAILDGGHKRLGIYRLLSTEVHAQLSGSSNSSVIVICPFDMEDLHGSSRT